VCLIHNAQFPFTKALPVAYSCDLSPQHEKWIERHLLTEQHKNMKGDSSIMDFFSRLNRPPPPSGPGPPHYTGFTIILKHTTFGRTPLNEWSTRRRDLYLTTQHTKQTSMPSVGFEPAIPSSKRLQPHTLDRAASGIGSVTYVMSRSVKGARLRKGSCKGKGKFFPLQDRRGPEGG